MLEYKNKVKKALMAISIVISNMASDKGVLNAKSVHKFDVERTGTNDLMTKLQLLGGNLNSLVGGKTRANEIGELISRYVGGK